MSSFQSMSTARRWAPVLLGVALLAHAACSVPTELGDPNNGPAELPGQGDAADARTRGTSPIGDDPATGADGGTEVSYAIDIQDIWDRRCSDCHSDKESHGHEGSPVHIHGELDLSREVSHDGLVGVPSHCDETQLRVVPGDLEKSLVWIMLTADVRQCGGAMPKGTSGLKGLAPAELTLIERWIQQGAKKN
jgi:hypothetical protein